MSTKVFKFEYEPHHLCGKKITNLPNTLYRIEDCYLIGKTGLLIDTNGQLIKEAIFDRGWYNTEECISRAEIEKYGPIRNEKNPLLKKLQNYINNYIDNYNPVKGNRFDSKFEYINLTHPFGFYAFGHIWDTLQKLYEIEKKNVKAKPIINYSKQIIDLPKYFKAFEYKWSNCQIYSLISDTIVYVPVLWHCSTFPKCQLTDETKPWILDKFKKAYSDAFKQTKPNKLYLVGRQTDCKKGWILNDDQLWNYLKNQGFKRVETFDSLEQAINLFYNAEVVIGPHGAILNNMIWSKSDCVYVELRSNQYNIDCWRRCSKTAEIKDYRVRILKGIKRKDDPKTRSFVANIAEIEHELLKNKITKVEKEMHSSYCILADSLNEDSIVLSFGVGRNIDFDNSISKKYKCWIYMFDPTPEDTKWIKTIELQDKIIFFPIGIYNKVGTAVLKKLDLRDNPNLSSTLLPRKWDGVKVEVQNITHLVTTFLGIKKIDLLKLDVEGVEYEVIDEIIDNNIIVDQITLEFHHHFGAIKISKTNEAIKKLFKAGYKLIYANESYSPTGGEGGNEYSFVHERLL